MSCTVFLPFGLLLRYWCLFIQVRTSPGIFAFDRYIIVSATISYVIKQLVNNLLPNFLEFA